VSSSYERYAELLKHGLVSQETRAACGQLITFGSDGAHYGIDLTAGNTARSRPSSPALPGLAEARSAPRAAAPVYAASMLSVAGMGAHLGGPPGVDGPPKVREPTGDDKLPPGQT
jgi:hypothetical protein